MRLKDQIFELQTKVPDKELFIAVNDIGTNVPASELFMDFGGYAEEYIRGYSPLSSLTLKDGYLVGAEYKICFYSQSLNSLILIKRVHNPIVMFNDKEVTVEFSEKYKQTMTGIYEKLKQPEEIRQPEGSEAVEVSPPQTGDGLVETESGLEVTPLVVEEVIEEAPTPVFEFNEQFEDDLLQKDRQLYLRYKKIKHAKDLKEVKGEIDGNKYLLVYMESDPEYNVLIVVNKDDGYMYHISPITTEKTFSVLWKNKLHYIQENEKSEGETVNEESEASTEVENPTGREKTEKEQEDEILGK